MGCCKGCLKFVQFLEFLADIGAFICVCIIVSLSSSNPFKSHIIGNIELYYSYPFAYNETSSLENSNYDNAIINETLSKEKIIDDTLLNENDNDDINKISSGIFNYKRFLRRKLESDSFCADMYDSFVRNNGKRLSYIFDLNYETIYGLSIALLIVTLGVIAFSITVFIFLIKGKAICCAGIFAILILLCWIAKFILFILLFHFIENGDIEKYDDFLDCRYVRTKYFKKFNDIEKLRKCFLAFTIFNLLSEIFDKAEKLFESGAKAEKDNDDSISSSTI